MVVVAFLWRCPLARVPPLGLVALPPYPLGPTLEETRHATEALFGILGPDGVKLQMIW